MATIPGNSLQERIHKINRQIHRPNTGVRQSITGVITQVYDRDTIDDLDLPNELIAFMLSFPGKIYCAVKLDTKEVVYLPLKESPELIYSIYGDSQLLIGRNCSVSYANGNKQNGEVTVLAYQSSLRETKKSSNVLDIGGIF